MTDLKGKVAIITGGSRGVGKAVALKFAEHGINVAIGAKTVTSADKSPGSIHVTVAEVEAKGAKTLAVQTDVRHEEQIENLVNRSVDAFGRVDFVKNAAAGLTGQTLIAENFLAKKGVAEIEKYKLNNPI